MGLGLFLTFYDGLRLKEFIRFQNAFYRQACLFYLADKYESIVREYGAEALRQMLEEPERFVSDDKAVIIRVDKGSFILTIEGFSAAALQKLMNFLKWIIFHEEYQKKLQIENEIRELAAREKRMQLIEQEGKIGEVLRKQLEDDLSKPYGYLKPQAAVAISELGAKHTLELLESLRATRCKIKLDADGKTIELNPEEAIAKK